MNTMNTEQLLTVEEQIQEMNIDLRKNKIIFSNYNKQIIIDKELNTINFNNKEYEMTKEELDFILSV